VSSRWPVAITADPELAEFNDQVELATDALLWPAETGRYREILIGYHGTQGARDALERVPALVSDGTEVTVVTVIGSTTHEEIDWQWRCIVEATAYLRSFGIDPYLEAATGNPATAILETAEELKADLVVIGCGRQVRPSLARSLNCDLLVVRSGARLGRTELRVATHPDEPSPA